MIACNTSALASSRRPPPSARAIADEMPPPTAPAESICIIVNPGKTSAMPASASAPRRETQKVSTSPVDACASMTATFGLARRIKVSAIGASRRHRKRGSRAGLGTGETEAAGTRYSGWSNGRMCGSQFSQWQGLLPGGWIAVQRVHAAIAVYWRLNRSMYLYVKNQDASAWPCVPRLSETNISSHNHGLADPHEQGIRSIRWSTMKAESATVQIGAICPTVSAVIHNNSMFNDTRLPCYAAKTRRTETGCGRSRMTPRRSPLTVRSSSVTRQRQTISLTCSFIARTPSQRQVTTWSVRSRGVRGWLG